MLKIKRPFYTNMIHHLQTAYPLEACGFLAGREGIVEQIYSIDNILQSRTNYEMDAKQQLEAMLDMEANGWEMVAIFHSHPNGPQTPSETDIKLAYYPEAIYLIISFEQKEQPIMRGYTIQDGNSSETTWELV